MLYQRGLTASLSLITACARAVSYACVNAQRSQLLKSTSIGFRRSRYRGNFMRIVPYLIGAAVIAAAACADRITLPVAKSQQAPYTEVGPLNLSLPERV